MAWARTRVALVFVLMLLDWWTPPAQAAGRHEAGATVAARPEAAGFTWMPVGAYLDDDDDHHHGHMPWLNAMAWDLRYEALGDGGFPVLDFELRIEGDVRVLGRGCQSNC